MEELRLITSSHHEESNQRALILAGVPLHAFYSPDKTVLMWFLPPATRLSHALRVECAAQTIVEGGGRPLNLDHCELNSRQTEAPVGRGKNLTLDDAGVVADRDELHPVA